MSPAVKHYVIAVLTAALPAAGLIASAPPAGAGCQSAQLLIFPTAQKCDGPVAPDGSWQRCVVYHHQPPSSPPEQSDCHPMGAGSQTTAHPFYDPPNHIDP